MARDFLRIVEHADDPLADSSALPVWTISREAARGNKVVLGGDGGDELFGGYLTYQASLLHARLAAAFPRRCAAAWPGPRRGSPPSEDKVSASYKAMRFGRALDLPTVRLTSPGTALGFRGRRPRWSGPRSRARRCGRADGPRAAAPPAAATGPQGSPEADIAEYLPNDILAKVDRMSMAHGLEVRAPFLQPAIADFALTLPDHLRLRRRPAEEAPPGAGAPDLRPRGRRRPEAGLQHTGPPLASRSTAGDCRELARGHGPSPSTSSTASHTPGLGGASRRPLPRLGDLGTNGAFGLAPSAVRTRPPVPAGGGVPERREYRSVDRADAARQVSMPAQKTQIQERTVADFGDQWGRYTDNSGFYGSLELFQDVFGPLLAPEMSPTPTSPISAAGPAASCRC